MMALTPVSLNSVAVIGAHCGDIAVGVRATLVEIVRNKRYLPIPSETAHQKARLLAECYPSQSGRGWFDDEAFLGLMRVRGVQCRARYAEAFTLERPY